MYQRMLSRELENLAHLIGRKLTGVMLKESKDGKPPLEQIFLFFDNEVMCEITNVNGFRDGGNVWQQSMEFPRCRP